MQLDDHRLGPLPVARRDQADLSLPPISKV